jgi:hypothetical protein
MRARRRQRFRLVAYVRYPPVDGPGFAYPLFGEHRTKTLYAQDIDEYSNTIRNFLPIHEQNEVITSFDGEIYATNGSTSIFVFIDDDGHVFGGELPTIERTLQSFLKKFPSHPGVCLQISELIGNIDQKRFARSYMKNVIHASNGAHSSKIFYFGSALQVALWNHLLKAAPSQESAQHILDARSRLHASVNEHGELNLDLADLAPSDYALISLEKLKDDLLKEFDFTPEITGSDVETDPFMEEAGDLRFRMGVLAALETISRARSPEERISLIWKTILEDRNTGLRVIALREEPTYFVQTAVSQTVLGLKGSRARDQKTVAALVDPIARKTGPHSRASLLRYLREHLGQYPLVAEAVRACQELHP